VGISFHGTDSFPEQSEDISWHAPPDPNVKYRMKVFSTGIPVLVDTGGPLTTGGLIIRGSAPGFNIAYRSDLPE